MNFKANDLQYFDESTGCWIQLGLHDTIIRVKPKETQLDLQIEVARRTSINIVTCPNCSSTLLHRQEAKTLTCPDCEHSGSTSEYPDLNY
jgi:predicted RNA-binding Zn-ribbon protein involved in translation (DUF1610 family)